MSFQSLFPVPRRQYHQLGPPWDDVVFLYFLLFTYLNVSSLVILATAIAQFGGDPNYLLAFLRYVMCCFLLYHTYRFRFIQFLQWQSVCGFCALDFFVLVLDAMLSWFLVPAFWIITVVNLAAFVTRMLYFQKCTYYQIDVELSGAKGDPLAHYKGHRTQLIERGQKDIREPLVRYIGAQLEEVGALLEVERQLPLTERQA
jgi:hypothetical protein